MNESEAKDFIERQVFRSLRGYGWVFLILASIIGAVFGRFAYVIGENAPVKSNIVAYDRINEDFGGIREEYGRFQEVRNNIEENLTSTEKRLDMAAAESQQILSDLAEIRETDVTQLVGDEALSRLRLALSGELGAKIESLSKELALSKALIKNIELQMERSDLPFQIYCERNHDTLGKVGKAYYLSEIKLGKITYLSTDHVGLVFAITDYRSPAEAKLIGEVEGSGFGIQSCKKGDSINQLRGNLGGVGR